MEEKVTVTETCQPEQEREELLSAEDTTPQADQKTESFIEVKFNKETRKLGLSEAATLAI